MRRLSIVLAFASLLAAAACSAAADLTGPNSASHGQAALQDGRRTGQDPVSNN